MLTIKELLTKLNSSDEFKKYKEKNKDSYLCACFLIYDNQDEMIWQLDYYNKKKHEVTSFLMSDKIEVKTSKQIFQKEKKRIEKLDINSIKIGFEKALGIIEDIKKKKYSNENPTKTIVILQNSKPVWNITYLTASFNILNVKISAITGEIISEKLDSVISFKK